MADDERQDAEGEPGSWADRLWGPRNPDALDLRPDLLLRSASASEPPDEPAGGVREDEDEDEPPADEDGADSPDPAATATAAAIRRLEGSLRKEIAASESRLVRALESRPPAGPDLDALAETAQRLSDLEAALARAADGQAELRNAQQAQLDAAIGHVADRIGQELAALRDATRQDAADQAAALERLLAAGAAAAAAATPAPPAPPALDADELGRTLQDAVAGTLGEATKRLSDELAANSSMLAGDVETALRTAADGQAAALDAVAGSIAERLGQQLEAVRADVSRQVGELTAGIERNRLELPERLGQVVAEAEQKQAALFERALGALAKAVADERRSSAAILRGSLASTDQALRDAYKWLEQVLAAVLEAARRSALNAEAAETEARKLRREVHQAFNPAGRPAQPPAQRPQPPR